MDMFNLLQINNKLIGYRKDISMKIRLTFLLLFTEWELGSPKVSL